MLKQQSQIPTCHLCDGDMTLDSVTYPDHMTGELMMVHQKCLDETGVTRRMKAVEEYKKWKVDTSTETSDHWCGKNVHFNEVRLRAEAEMSFTELLSYLVGTSKIVQSISDWHVNPTSEPQPKKVGTVKLGKWTVTTKTWREYVDTVSEMKSSYTVPFDDGENTPMPKDPLEQLATFQQRVNLHKKLFKEAGVPYHQNKNATHASHELSQLMSDRLEKEI